MNSDEAPVKAEEAKAEDVSPAQPAQEGDPAVSFALPISKTQAKKAVRKAKQAEDHKARKEAKKEQAKEVRATKRQKTDCAVQSMTEDEKKAFREQAKDNQPARTNSQDTVQGKHKQRDGNKAVAGARLAAARKDGVKIIIDLDFPGKMLEREIKSLVQQLAYSVGCNRKATVPCSLHLTSLAGPLAALVAKQYPTHGQWAAEQHAAPFSEVFADMKDRLVYLTADATTELTELLPDHAYIIGGIVDRNRYKNLCLDRAKELGIKSARLPIGDHLKLAGSKVLTVNQVLAMMVKHLETQDWGVACEHVIPTRKVADKVKPASGQPASSAPAAPAPDDEHAEGSMAAEFQGEEEQPAAAGPSAAAAGADAATAGPDAAAAGPDAAAAGPDADQAQADGAAAVASE